MTYIKQAIEKATLNEAQVIAQCPQNGMEFGEFLEVEEGDEVEN